MKIFRIAGLSMFPTIKPGELVYVEGLQENPKRGDLLLFGDDNGRQFLHRCVEVRKQNGKITWIVKGDGYGRRIDELSLGQILGRAMLVECNGNLQPLLPKSPTWATRSYAYCYYWALKLWRLLKLKN